MEICGLGAWNCGEREREISSASLDEVKLASSVRLLRGGGGWLAGFGGSSGSSAYLVSRLYRAYCPSAGLTVSARVQSTTSRLSSLVLLPHHLLSSTEHALSSHNHQKQHQSAPV